MCFFNKSCPKIEGLKGTMTSVTDPIALIQYDPDHSNKAVYIIYTHTEFNSGCLHYLFKEWIVSCGSSWIHIALCLRKKKTIQLKEHDEQIVFV